jgi:hypothetical protein
MTEEELQNLPVVSLAILVDNIAAICDNFTPNESVFFAHVILDQGMAEVKKVDLQLFELTDEGLAEKVYNRLVALKLI